MDLEYLLTNHEPFFARFTELVPGATGEFEYYVIWTH